MVFGKEFFEKTRRREFKSSFSVESCTSESGSDSELYSPSLSVRRKYDHLQRTKSFHQIMSEMSSNTRKLEEETSGLLRDLVRVLITEQNRLKGNF